MAQIIDYTTFCHAVGFLCQSQHCSNTSWWRSPQRNKEVGGVKNSLHLMGLACDLILDDMSAENKTELISVAESLGLKALDRGSHIHVQIRT